MFLGLNRCVICGEDSPHALEYCYISARSETREDWVSLMQLNWIPSQAKTLPHHEPRNSMLMCKNHHTLFDEYEFFIRFLPDESNGTEGGKFVFVNFSGNPRLSRYHGKAIALDITHRYAPFPSLFIVHEFRVRGIHPFQPRNPLMPDEIAFQDWILWDGVVNDDSRTFNRQAVIQSGQPQVQPQSATTITSDPAPRPGGRTVALNADVIADILAATRAMASWKACQMEGTSWSGTADENVEKYLSTIGAEDDGQP